MDNLVLDDGGNVIKDKSALEAGANAATAMAVTTGILSKRFVFMVEVTLTGLF